MEGMEISQRGNAARGTRTHRWSKALKESARGTQHSFARENAKEETVKPKWSRKGRLCRSGGHPAYPRYNSLVLKYRRSVMQLQEGNGRGDAVRLSVRIHFEGQLRCGE